MSSQLLNIKNLSISFKNKDGSFVDVLHGVNLSLNQGECLCLVGESGSGKSLSAYSIVDLLPESAVVKSGEITFDGKSINTLSEKQKQSIRGNQIGFIFQEPLSALNPLFTIGQQIDEAIKLHSSQPKTERYKKIIDLLNTVKLDNAELRYNSYPHELSGGQRQRVCIAIALANKCKLLIADEPTTALDVSVQKEVLTLIKDLQKQHNLAVLFITHDFSVVEEMADNVAVMKNGKIVEYGNLDSVLNTPKQDYTKMLLNSMPGNEDFIDSSLKEVILKVENLNKEFKLKNGLFKKPLKIKALNNISFNLAKNQTLAIVGESGSGKSTLVRVISGLLKPESGIVNLMSVNITNSNEKQLRVARRNMQMIFQDPLESLNPRMSIYDNVSEGIIAYNIMPKSEIRPYLESIFKDCKLKASDLDKFPTQFSGGQRQRICIAKALALKPKLLIADEAVSALDLSVQKTVLDLLKSLKHKYDLSILFITHDLRVVKEIADTVLVMQNGNMVEYNNTQTIFNKPKSEYTNKLLDAIPGKI